MRSLGTRVFLVFLMFLGSLLWVMFDTHILQVDGQGTLLTGESTYGDLPYHLSQIAQMSYGQIFPPQNPLFANHPLRYPYAINFISAVLVNLGLSLRDSIILPGMFFSLLMATFLYLFFKAITKNFTVSILGTFLFWFNGGLGFYYFFRDIVLTRKFSDFINNPGSYQDYSHLFTENIQWNNFLSRIVVPERSVLLGIPMGLLIIYFLFIRKNNLKVLTIQFVVAAILTGLLPITHTHTFLVLALVIPILGLYEIRKYPINKWVIRWVIFGIIVLVIAGPWLSGMINQVESSNEFIKFKFGWMAPEGFGEFILFWLKNAGILIPLMVISLFIKKVPLLAKKLTICGLVILILINLFQFQPYDWDNVKFLFWTSVFGSLSAAYVLQFIWGKWKPFGKFIALLIFLGLTTSSFISIYREVHLQHGLFTKEEVELGDWVRQYTPKNSIFLTAPIHNSFVSNFGGRRILMGYQGLLWVHGIDYSRQERAMKDIYKGGIGAISFLKQYDISYVVVGPRELIDLKANWNFFERNFCLVKDSVNYKIYSVNCHAQK